ncbi:MAG: hypothetical protein ACRC0L_01260 [Angustibacter sp.]
MQSVADQIRVSLLIADFAAGDAAGKANIIGAGSPVIPVDPSHGQTAPQSVLALLDVPPTLYEEEFVVTLALHDGLGELVQVPAPAGGTHALRIANVVKAPVPTFQPGVYVPSRTVWGHTQVVLNFPTGLPLERGQLYTWRLSIDSTSDPRWATSFYVPGADPGPVIG